MSDEERKKNGEYEKPESKGMGGEELEDVSGGAGDEPVQSCFDGSTAKWMACGLGGQPEQSLFSCKSGAHPGNPSICRDGGDTNA